MVITCKVNRRKQRVTVAVLGDRWGSKRCRIGTSACRTASWVKRLGPAKMPARNVRTMEKDGIGQGGDERAHLGHRRSEADPLGEGDEDHHTAEGHYRVVGEGDPDCLGAIQWGNLCLHRFTPGIPL